MYKIGIIGDDGVIADELQRLLESCETIPADSNSDFDILIINGAGNTSLSAPVIVLNSDENISIPPSQGANPRLLITYGFNSKASITSSSVQHGEICVCVQRAFTTPSGLRRERQEFAVMTRNPLATLAAVSAALTTELF